MIANHESSNILKRVYFAQRAILKGNFQRVARYFVLSEGLLTSSEFGPLYVFLVVFSQSNPIQSPFVDRVCLIVGRVPRIL